MGDSVGTALGATAAVGAVAATGGAAIPALFAGGGAATVGATAAGVGSSLLTAAAVGGSALSAFSSIQQGRLQAAQSEFQAQQSEMQAQQARTAATEKANIIRRQTLENLASINAQATGAFAKRAAEETLVSGTRDIRRVETSGQITSLQREAQASEFRKAAPLQKQAGISRGAGTLLTTGREFI